MTDVVTYEFGVTDTPPPLRRTGGPGRQRRNPFDEKVRQSYEDGWYEETPERPDGRWHTFNVPADQRNKVYNQIRNSGNYQELGTNIRMSTTPDEDGNILFAFRGKPPDERPRGTNPSVPEQRNGNDADNFGDEVYD